MRRRREPLFLARQSYRRRRLEDAARLLPLLGAFLFLVTLLASGASEAARDLYVFITWIGLILAAFVISRGLSRLPAIEDQDDALPGSLQDGVDATTPAAPPTVPPATPDPRAEDPR